MKQINKDYCWHIISEPGDLTRYEYIFICTGGDYFFINLINNEFSVLEEFNFIEPTENIKNVTNEIVELANDKNINPYRLNEYLRTIQEYRQGEIT